MTELIPLEIEGLRLPARFVASLTLAADPQGSLVAAAFTPAARDSPPADGVTAVIFDGGVHHYFHFIEALIWLVALVGQFLPGCRLVRIVFAWPWDNAAQNHVQRDSLASLFPGIEIVDPGWPMPATYPDVLIIDRAWWHTTIHKFLEASLPFAAPFAMALGHAARQAVGASEALAGAVPRILYVRRPPPRCLVPPAEAELLALLAEHGLVTQCDFATLPWAQQVRLVAAHEVLVGVHGNGLTNAVWMRPGSLVLELFPDQVQHYDFQLLAELCGLRYFGFERDRVFPAFGRFGPPYGHQAPTQCPLTAIPRHALARILARQNLLF